MTPKRHSNASLALKPADANARCDLSAIIGLCRNNGLAGDAIAGRQHHYRTGERFLEQITFLGCSPNIQFEATDDEQPFTHLVFHQYEQPVLHHGAHTRPPHCPQCNKPLKNWQDLLSRTHWPCPHCQQSSPAVDYRWRKTAGFARTLIEITDIYPREALPQPSLLQQLAKMTSMQWDYFYY